MHKALKQIPDRILRLAQGALAQANTHAVFMDPGTEHWEHMSILNTAHAGELFLKAIISTEHPLLIFRDIFNLDDTNSKDLEISALISKGKTHDFEKLPSILWATTGQRVPDINCYERLRRARNAIQHFVEPENEDPGKLSLEFIYKIIDPLIAKNFNLCAIEYHEDQFYDYVVGQVIRSGLKFTLPTDFRITEIDIAEEAQNTSNSYKTWLKRELRRIGRSELYS